MIWYIACGSHQETADIRGNQRDSMNLQVPYDEEAKNKATNSPLNNEHLAQIPTRLLNETSQDKRLEPVLRHLLEAAITAASEAEQRVIE